jgi:glutaryl-CoA dehydrogenase
MTDTMASLAKMDNARKAHHIIAEARDEYHVACHWADMDAVYTHEGTDSINSLIVGRTGDNGSTGVLVNEDGTRKVCT